MARLRLSGLSASSRCCCGRGPAQPPVSCRARMSGLPVSCRLPSTWLLFLLLLPLLAVGSASLHRPVIVSCEKRISSGDDVAGETRRPPEANQLAAATSGADNGRRTSATATTASDNRWQTTTATATTTITSDVDGPTATTAASHQISPNLTGSARDRLAGGGGDKFGGERGFAPPASDGQVSIVALVESRPQAAGWGPIEAAKNGHKREATSAAAATAGEEALVSEEAGAPASGERAATIKCQENEASKLQVIDEIHALGAPGARRPRIDKTTNGRDDKRRLVPAGPAKGELVCPNLDHQDCVCRPAGRQTQS
jgi:hypothetical protein